ncbi:MAG TPA: hypothetical protein VE569_01950, partial [Acidimicrobiia bacterium]|nr:hypothetical protein [Acidimicrobiia bacterium]
MLTTPAPWETRVHKTVVIGQWIAFVIGLLSSLIVDGPSGLAIGALAVTGLYAIGSTVIPESWYRRRFGSDAIPLIGAVLMLVAMTMTGGASSPYLLLSMGPPIIATVYGG